MADLNALVKTIVSEFITNSQPFTALDISNKVKETLPDVRHREVSPLVRDLYRNGEMKDYDRTVIRVKAEDGSEPNTNLYHSLSDTWDLDSKYDDVKRAQIARAPKKDVAPVANPFVTDVLAGLADINAGNIKSHDEVMKELKAAYKPPVKVQPTVLPPSIWDAAFDRLKKKFTRG